VSVVRFVIIGYGHIGKRHAAMIERHPEAVLVAVVDPQTPLDLPVCPHFVSWQEYLMAGIKADIAVVATPNGLHVPQALQALNEGLHVVVEKPMGLSAASVKELMTAAIEKHLQLFPVMQNRYSPPAQWIKSVVEQGLLGDIYLVQLNCFWNRDARYYLPRGWHGDKQLDGGTLFTQFSHFIDTLYWLLGRIRNVQGRLFDFNHQQLTDFEDSGLFTFELERGGAGSLQFSSAVYDQNFESSITLIGSKGTVKLGGQYMETVSYCHIADYNMPNLPPTNPGNDYGTYKGSAANHQFVIQNVVDVLHGRAPITTTPEDGLAVVEMIEQLYQAGRQIR
jgi:UDP-N-acetyl-2-amino-2-deoxyglucuronate dehydrogenase